MCPTALLFGRFAYTPYCFVVIGFVSMCALYRHEPERSARRHCTQRLATELHYKWVFWNYDSFFQKAISASVESPSILRDKRDYNLHVNKPTLVYHADWSSHAAHRWCAKAILGTDRRYTASAPVSVANPRSLVESLRNTVGDSGTVFAGFDFPMGLPSHYAKCADKSSFRDFLLHLGTDDWKHFYSVCDQPDQITIHRPFYPNQCRRGCLQQHLLNGHRALNMTSLLRRCEVGGNGQIQACSLFWTLGPKAVGKAAITGWREMLVPAVQMHSVRIWPFDGKLGDLLQPGNTVIAETYPAECYGWFPGEPLGSKTDIECRRVFGSRLLTWARINEVAIDPRLETAIRSGFPEENGNDDGFDAVVGLFGVLQIILGQRLTGEPEDETVRNVEGWILGRRSQPVEQAPVRYSAATDPELAHWLRWVRKAERFPSSFAQSQKLRSSPICRVTAFCARFY